MDEERVEQSTQAQDGAPQTPSRLAPGKSGRLKWGLIAAALAVVGVASAYLGLSSWVGTSQKILPNVSIAGVDVSNMTQDQARAAVDQAVEQYGRDATVTLRCGDWSGTLSCADLERDSSVCAAAALGAGRGVFLTQGYQYLRALAGGSSQVGLSAGELHLAQPAFDKLLEQADEEIGGSVRQTTWTVEEDELSLTKGKTGTSFDRDMVLRLAAQAADEALAAAVSRNGPADVAVDLSAHEGALTQAPPEQPDFEALHQELYVEAKSASLDPETHEILPHAVGVDFDVTALQNAYAQAPEGGSFTIPLTITQPAETAESLQGKLFQDILGQATSKLSNDRDRTHNVKLAASACNGVILLPGEIFSYNDTTGSRSADKGYRPGNVYVGGRTELGTGGGVCQPSSTIYYALLHSTLEVVERHCHKYAVGYVPDGMDATVYFGSLDFRFKNNTDYPVKIVTESYEKDGATYLTATLYGTNVTGRYAKPQSSVYDRVAPTDSYQPDPSVPRGTLVLDRVQNAYTGRKASTYRYIYEADGTLVEKQTMGASKYAMRPHLYHYNPLDGDPSTWVDGKPPAAVTEPTEPTLPTEPVDPTEPVIPTEPSGPETPATQPSGEGPDGPEEGGTGQPPVEPGEDQTPPEDGLGEGQVTPA